MRLRAGGVLRVNNGTRMNRCFAELIGTFTLVFAGTGAIVINHASGGAIGHLGIAPDLPGGQIQLPGDNRLG